VTGIERCETPLELLTLCTLFALDAVCTTASSSSSTEPDISERSEPLDMFEAERVRTWVATPVGTKSGRLRGIDCPVVEVDLTVVTSLAAQEQGAGGSTVVIAISGIDAATIVEPVTETGLLMVGRCLPAAR
jgi:hypothetical protein